MNGSDIEKRILEANVNNPVDRGGEFVESEAYPHLFPHGFGDFSDKDRPINLKQREYVQHRLLAHPEFQKDESWAFRALNNLNQQDMVRAIQYILKTAASKKQTTEMTSGDLLRAMQSEDGDIDGEEILGHHYFMVGSAIRGTSMYFKKARRHLFSMFATLGAPDLFLTLSANDLEWLDLFHSIDPQRFKTEESVTVLTHAERVGHLNDHPAICSEHFSNRVHSLISFLASPAKPLVYEVKNFFGRLEIQGRGSPHLHSVLWLEGAPKPDSGDRFLQWVDTIISAQLPDENTDPELHHFVQKFQIHHHTPSCGGMQEKEVQGKQMTGTAKVHHVQVQESHLQQTQQQAQQSMPQTGQSAETRREYAILTDRASCRFGYPHPLAESTHLRKGDESKITVKGDRQIILKRTSQREQWINNYSPNILRIWRANMDLQPVTDPYAAAAYMLSYITKDEKSERSFVKEALKKLPDNPTMTQVLTKIANAIVTFREVSKQEAMLLMLSIPLYFSSITSVFVPSFPPDQRRKSSLPYSILSQQDPNSTEIWQENIIDHYGRRPVGVPWDSMTLLQFSTWFEVTTVAAETRRANGREDVGLPAEHEELQLNEEQEEQEEEPEVDDDDNNNNNNNNIEDPASAFELNPHWGESYRQPPFIKKLGEKGRKMPRFLLLSGNKGKVARMRKSPRCVTTPMSNIHNLVTKYTLLAMNTPFRDELHDLLGISDPQAVTEERVDEAILRNRECINSQRAHMADNFAERVSEILNKVQLTRNQSLKARPDNDDLLGVFHENELMQAMESAAPAAPATVIAHVRDNEEDLPDLMTKLSQEQREVLHKVQSYLEQVDVFDSTLQSWKRTKEAAEAFPGTTAVLPQPTPPTPPRLIVLGPGGTGKSFLILTLMLAIRKWAKVRCATKPSPQQGVVLAAPTGIAAFNVGGSTIHSAFQLKVEKNGYGAYQRLNGLSLNSFTEKFRNVQAVIIDEVSMVGARVLSQIHQRLNQAMSTPEGFFGNIAVILLGDFLQLRPVRAKTIFSQDSTELDIVPGRFHLYHSLFQPVFLTIPQRQKGDQVFSNLLLRAREGQLTDEDDVALNSRSLNQLNPDRSYISTLLQTEFAKATWLYPYKVMVNAHNGKEIRKLSENSGFPIIQMRAVDEGKITVPKEADVDSTGGLSTEITLVKGAAVMLRHNIDVEDGLYNGAQGTIASIPEINGTAPMPIFVHFEDPRIGTRAERKDVDGKIAVRINPKTASFDLNGKQVKRTQLPVILSFAMTIHKAQGLTLNKVVAHCGEGVFEAGMAYTAASRVRRFGDLIFSEYSPLAFKANDGALEELERLRNIKK